MDWFTCISCNNIITVDYSDEDNFIFRNDFEICCATCNNKNKIDELLLLPEIITPTMVKCLSSQLFINLWKVASDYLRTADKIIFIGYSFPTSDFEFRYFLKKNIKNNAEIIVILQEVDDPKNPSNKNIIKKLPEYGYKSLFVKQKPAFYYNGFENYFNNNS